MRRVSMSLVPALAAGRHGDRSVRPRRRRRPAARWCRSPSPSRPTSRPTSPPRRRSARSPPRSTTACSNTASTSSPRPALAESWDVAPDGKTVTFKLRKDVKFHDGKPFTSADVQFTIMDVLKKVHPRGINTFRDVTAVETPDEHTAVFKLANAAPYMLSALSGYESPMLPKHVFSQGDIRTHANANQPIGTGPFKFVEWRRGELVRLDKNPDYWRKGLPYLDRIVVRFINDEATRTAALEKGEAHVAGFGGVPYNDAKKLAHAAHRSR